MAQPPRYPRRRTREGQTGGRGSYVYAVYGASRRRGQEPAPGRGGMKECEGGKKEIDTDERNRV